MSAKFSVRSVARALASRFANDLFVFFTLFVTALFFGIQPSVAFAGRTLDPAVIIVKNNRSLAGHRVAVWPVGNSGIDCPPFQHPIERWMAPLEKAGEYELHIPMTEGPFNNWGIGIYRFDAEFSSYKLVRNTCVTVAFRTYGNAPFTYEVQAQLPEAAPIQLPLEIIEAEQLLRKLRGDSAAALKVGHEDYKAAAETYRKMRQIDVVVAGIALTFEDHTDRGYTPAAMVGDMILARSALRKALEILPTDIWLLSAQQELDREYGEVEILTPPQLRRQIHLENDGLRYFLGWEFTHDVLEQATGENPVRLLLRVGDYTYGGTSFTVKADEVAKVVGSPETPAASSAAVTSATLPLAEPAEMRSAAVSSSTPEQPVVALEPMAVSRLPAAPSAATSGQPRPTFNGRRLGFALEFPLYGIGGAQDMIAGFRVSADFLHLGPYGIGLELPMVVGARFDVYGRPTLVLALGPAFGGNAPIFKGGATLHWSAGLLGGVGGFNTICGPANWLLGESYEMTCGLRSGKNGFSAHILAPWVGPTVQLNVYGIKGLPKRLGFSVTLVTEIYSLPAATQVGRTLDVEASDGNAYELPYHFDTQSDRLVTVVPSVLVGVTVSLPTRTD